jgi:hypothetical protein
LIYLNRTYLVFASGVFILTSILVSSFIPPGGQNHMHTSVCGPVCYWSCQLPIISTFTQHQQLVPAHTVWSSLLSCRVRLDLPKTMQYNEQLIGESSRTFIMSSSSSFAQGTLAFFTATDCINRNKQTTGDIFSSSGHGVEGKIC